MPIPTCTVRVRLHRDDGEPEAGAHVTATLDRVQVYDGLVVPARVAAVADADGECELALWPNALGAGPSVYNIRIEPLGRQGEQLLAIVPEAVEADLEDILVASAGSSGTPGQAFWGRIGGDIQLQSDLLALLNQAVSAVTSVNGNTGAVALTGTDIAVDATPGALSLAAVLAAHSSDLILAARYGSGPLRRSLKASGISAEGPTVDKLPLIKAVEESLYAVAAATGQTAVLVMDENYYINSPFLCRTRVSIKCASGAGLRAMSTFEGAEIFRSVPTVGKVTDALIHQIDDINIHGGRIGAHKGVCTATADSAVLTNVAFVDGYVPREFDVLTGNCGLRIGAVPTWIVAGGVAGGPGNWTLTVSLPAEYNNFNLAEPARDAKDVFALEGSGSAKTGSGAAGQYWIIVNSLAGIKLGMRALGNNLEVDAVDLNQTSRVEEIDVPGLRVRLSRKVVSAGTFDMLFWTEVQGLVVDFADTAPGYNPALKYEPVHANRCYVHDCSGDLVVVRGGRDATHLNGGRASAGIRNGIYAIPSDMRFGMSVGECYGINWNFRSGATPRSIGVAEYYSGNNPAQPNVLVLGARELDFAHGDITGTVEIRGANGEPLSACNISNWNLKWGASCAHPDDNFPSAFLRTVNTAVVNLSFGCVKGDPAQLPQYFYHRDGGGYLRVHDLTMEVAEGLPMTPYKAALTNSPQSLEMRVYNPTTGLMYMTCPGGMLIESSYGAIAMLADDGLTLGDDITIAGPLKYVDDTTIGFPNLTNGGSYTIPPRQIKTNVRNGAALASQTFVLPEPSTAGVNVYEICTLAGVTSPTMSAAGGRTVNNPYTSFAPGVVYKWALRRANNQWYPSA